MQVNQNPKVCESDPTQSLEPRPIAAFLRTLHPDHAFEIRSINVRSGRNETGASTGTVSGFFKDVDKAGSQIVELDRDNDCTAIYVTLNPVRDKPTDNPWDELNRAKATTTDKHIAARRWILIDCDPIRPKGTSSTDEEVRHALDRVNQIAEFLAEHDFGQPMRVMSGNGAHLYYPVDLPADDGGLVKRLLHGLSKKFTDDLVDVDKVVGNASRITKIAGTWARKGKDDPQSGRVHRIAQWLNPDWQRPESISRPVIEKLVEQLDVKPDRRAQQMGAAGPTGVPGAGDVEQRLIQGCSFMAHCKQDAAELSEPQWYAMLGQLARVSGGDELAHAWSEPYPGYDAQKTDQKFEQAAGHPARSCRTIADDLGWTGCEVCPNRGKVGSPHKLVGVTIGGSQPLELYYADEQGMWKRSLRPGQSDQRLTDFRVTIEKELVTVSEQDEPIRRQFVCSIFTAGSQVPDKRTLDTKQFAKMEWVDLVLGSRGSLFPGSYYKDEVATAIKYLSPNVPVERIYCHTGWVQINDQPVFLHGDGAIGADGHIEEVHCELTQNLRHYRLMLPDNLDQQREDTRRVLDLADQLPPSLGIPVIGHALRSVLGNNMMGVMLAGDSGAMKTSLASVVQSFFGQDFSRQRLPSKFVDTANSLRNKAHLAKDVLMVADEYKTRGGGERDRVLEEKLDHLVRGVANGAGASRMNRNLDLVPEDTPRAAPLITGEKADFGHSLRARCWICYIEPGQLQGKQMDELHRLRREGVYCRFTGGYVRWLAADHHRHIEEIEQQVSQNQPEQPLGDHRRIDEMYANLMVAWRTFMEYCKAIKVIDESEADNRLDQIRQLLSTDGQELALALSEDKPAQRMLSLLGQALATSQAVVANLNGERPIHAAQLGWNHPSMNGNNQVRINSHLIGWVDESLPEPLLYLLPDHALRMAQKMSGQNEEIRSMEYKQMGKQLSSCDLLVKTEGNRQTPLYRKTISGTSQKVWVVKLSEVVELDQTSGATTGYRLHTSRPSEGSAA